MIRTFTAQSRNTSSPRWTRSRMILRRGTVRCDSILAVLCRHFVRCLGSGPRPPAPRRPRGEAWAVLPRPRPPRPRNEGRHHTIRIKSNRTVPSKAPLRKEARVTVESELAARMYSSLSTPPGKATYNVSRFVVEKLQSATIAVERLLKSPALSPTMLATISRAGTLMTTMSCVICLLRPLQKNEKRADVVLKAHKALTSGRFDSQAPLACIDSALAGLVGATLDWTVAPAKRARA